MRLLLSLSLLHSLVLVSPLTWARSHSLRVNQYSRSLTQYTHRTRNIHNLANSNMASSSDVVFGDLRTRRYNGDHLVHCPVELYDQQLQEKVRYEHFYDDDV